MFLICLGKAQARLERCNESEATFLESHAILTAKLGESHPQARKPATALTGLYEMCDRPEEEAKWRAWLEASE